MTSDRRLDGARAIIRRVDLGAFTDELLGSITGRGPGRPRSSSWQGSLVDLVRAHCELFVSAVARGGVPGDHEVAALAGEIRRGAPGGLALADIERSYRAVSEVGLRHLVAHTRPGEGESLTLVADTLMAFVAGVPARIIEAYLDQCNGDDADEERWARRRLDALDAPADADAAPGPGAVDGDARGDEAGRAGSVLAGHGPLVPFAATALAGTAAAHTAIAVLARRRGCLAASEGDRVVGVVAGEAAVRSLVRADAIPEMALVVGRPAFAGHLADARRPLGAVAKAAATRGQSGVIDLADHGPEALVELEPDIADALVVRIFGPLSPELAETVVALVHHDFDRRAVALALRVHRNTVLYRCGRIEELTGLDLRRLPHRTLVHLAVARRRLADARLHGVSGDGLTA